MELDSSMKDRRLARFACDFCHKKKLKCSRELPKCSLCQPWPGDCIYSRDEGVSCQAPVEPSQTYRQHGSNFETRLQRIEENIQSLDDSMNKILDVLSALSSSKAATRPSTSLNQTNERTKHLSEHSLYIGSSHSFSFMKQRSAEAGTSAKLGINVDSEGAISEMRNLCSEIASETIRGLGLEPLHYHIPSRSAGYSFIGKFLEIAERGKPFFDIPSDDVLQKIVFDPQSVCEKSWVVFFNYILLSDISEGQDDKEDSFRRNAHLALNDCRIFIEPRLSNIQALVLLSFHGEDFAAPNISWMLLSHACRQAEALGLHVSTSPKSSTAYEHKLSLFWLLYTIDKSCALAFGRPMFLPTSLYRNVPLPTERSISEFQPHNGQNERLEDQGFEYGSAFFKATFELSHLTGEILQILAVETSGEERNEVRSRLDAWFIGTNTRLLSFLELESPRSNSFQTREMVLGINAMKFQYLHISLLLLKGNSLLSDTRLSLAREAISLLPSLISNWKSVYNGVIWQLLYYPFTPFFVVFENIVNNTSRSYSSESDLKLLKSTTTYFRQMSLQMKKLRSVCAKLEDTAAVFYRLAQSHVLNHFGNPKATRPSNQASKRPRLDSPKSIDTEDDIITGDVNVMNLLGWLPVDMNVTCRTLEGELQSLPGHQSQDSSYKDRSTSSGRNQTSDGIFDWFAWDAYYTGSGAAPGTDA